MLERVTSQTTRIPIELDPKNFGKEIELLSSLPTKRLPGAPAILCGHGFSGDAAGFSKFLKGMAQKGMPAHAFSLLGHGLSSDRGHSILRHSFKDYLNNVLEAIKYLRKSPDCPKKIYLLGHSNGGLLAQAAMKALIDDSQCPEELKNQYGLILVESPRSTGNLLNNLDFFKISSSQNKALYLAAVLANNANYITSREVLSPYLFGEDTPPEDWQPGKESLNYNLGALIRMSPAKAIVAAGIDVFIISAEDSPYFTNSAKQLEEAYCVAPERSLKAPGNHMGIVTDRYSEYSEILAGAILKS